MEQKLRDLMFRFFTDDVGGPLITDGEGKTVHEDARVRAVLQGDTNWGTACPAPREGQRGERWDLINKDSGHTYMVVSSTYKDGEDVLQFHHFTDSSEYTKLFRDINDYSGVLRYEKEHDSMTGLYNKGKFMSLKESLFRDRESLTVFNMDVNNLKYMNDNFGHEAGDALIKKAAESLQRITSRSVLTFRMGGDEFLAVALNHTREKALQLLEKWKAGLEELNRRDDGIECVIACGFAYGEKGYDLDRLLDEADRLMYEDKKAKKAARG